MHVPICDLLSQASSWKCTACSLQTRGSSSYVLVATTPSAALVPCGPPRSTRHFWKPSGVAGLLAFALRRRRRIASCALIGGVGAAWRACVRCDTSRIVAEYQCSASSASSSHSISASHQQLSRRREVKSSRKASISETSILDRILRLEDEDFEDGYDSDEEEDPELDLALAEDNDDVLPELMRPAKFAQQKMDTNLESSRERGHVPVLLFASMQFLFPTSCIVKKGDTVSGDRHTGNFVDCTFGRGGHSREILSRLDETGRLFAFDVDPTAAEIARTLERSDDRFTFIQRPFGDIADAMKGTPVHGVLMDIGISSPQVDEVSRGFSLQDLSKRKDTRLDLRMNPSAGQPASEWLQSVSVEELAWVLQHYGDDVCTTHPVLAERMAQIILDDQDENGPFETMSRFAEVVGKARQRMFYIEDGFEHTERGLNHPAKLTLQAIRLFLNQEMEQLDGGLYGAMNLLVPGGRCLVSTFKKQEAVKVWDFVLAHEDPTLDESASNLRARRLSELYPLVHTDLEYSVKLLCKPIRPSLSEIARNARARSGSLFVMEKSSRQAKRVKTRPRLQKNRFVQPPLPPFVGEDSARK